MNEKIIGYARTAHREQDISSQIEKLKAAGCSVVYTDQGVSGSTLERPGLKEARANLQSGDVLKVVTIDRIARSISALNTFVTDLKRHQIGFEAVTNSDAFMVTRLCDALNYGPVISQETPWLRKLTYRLGAFLIRVSGRGAIPSR
jgi:hypothetical protein